LGSSRSDQIAHHREASRQTNAYLERFRRRHAANRLDDSQAGAHGTLSIVLVGLRIAEVSEHPVAHVLRNKAVEAADGLGNAPVIRADHFPQVLRIEPRRQCGRADKIAEHDRELTALGAIGARW
jgi:hypothetical protein